METLYQLLGLIFYTAPRVLAFIALAYFFALLIEGTDPKFLLRLITLRGRIQGWCSHHAAALAFEWRYFFRRGKGGDAIEVLRRCDARLKKIAVMILLMAFMPAPVAADTLTEANKAQARSWVMQATGLKKLSMPIVSQSPVMMAAALRNGPVAFAGIRGAYSHGVIYIMPAFDPIEDMPFLVHEMVHHAQRENPRFKSKDCRLGDERLAYELQNRFAAEYGYSVRIPQSFIDRASNCGE